MRQEKLVGNTAKGLVIILSGPAGTGKTTLVNLLKEEFSCVVESISYTTRKPRGNETDGKEYYFISKEEFQKKIKKQEFLEYASVFEDLYGTGKKEVEQYRKKGKHVILVIDTQGAQKLKKKVDSISVFISPPSLKELQFRLHSRKSESELMIQKRLSWAKKEIACASRYDYHIINDQLDIAYQVLRAILIAEEHRVKKEKSSFFQAFKKKVK